MHVSGNNGYTKTVLINPVAPRMAPGEHALLMAHVRGNVQVFGSVRILDVYHRNADTIYEIQISKGTMHSFVQAASQGDRFFLFPIESSS